MNNDKIVSGEFQRGMAIKDGSELSTCQELLSDDLVLARAIAWFIQEGAHVLYKTRTIADGAIGGVDAILFDSDSDRFTFIDAKGKATSPAKRSNAFTNCLGALMKRIRFETGYAGVESADLFSSPGDKKRVAKHARHRNSDYIIALTPD